MQSAGSPWPIHFCMEWKAFLVHPSAVACEQLLLPIGASYAAPIPYPRRLGGL